MKQEIDKIYPVRQASQVALVVKNMPANAENRRGVGRSPGREDPLEEGTAAHSSTGGFHG